MIVAIDLYRRSLKTHFHIIASNSAIFGKNKADRCDHEGTTLQRCGNRKRSMKYTSSILAIVGRSSFSCHIISNAKKNRDQEFNHPPKNLFQMFSGRMNFPGYGDEIINLWLKLLFTWIAFQWIWFAQHDSNYCKLKFHNFITLFCDLI